MTTRNTKPATKQEYDARIKELAKYNRANLEGMTVALLKHEAAGLIKGISKLKKAKLIDAILELTKPLKEKQLRDTAISMELMSEFDIDESFLNRAYVENLPPEYTADVVAKKLLDLHEKGVITASTMAKTKMKNLRVILDSVKLADSNSSEWCNETYKLVREQIKVHDREVNRQYNEETKETYGDSDKGGLVFLDKDKIIDWMNDTIDWAIEQDNLEKGWHKVSFALALATGRRMVEIHGTTKFEKVDENHLKTIGLAKKESDDVELVSPCLINTDKWLAAYSKLPEKRRNQHSDIVNKVISRAISEAIASIIDELGFRNANPKNNKTKGSYKDSRDFYAAYLIEERYHKKAGKREAVYVKEALGHTSKRQGDSYQKIAFK